MKALRLRNLAGLFVAAVGFALFQAHDSSAGSAMVSPLYDTNANLVGLLLPFQVSGLPQGSVIQTASVAVDNGADCRVMADPYLAQTYLLKCAASGSVTLKFNYSSPAGSAEVDYGPVVISALSGTAFVKPTPTTSGDTPISRGSALWQSNSCGTCHGNSVPLPKGASVAEITNALATVPTMSAFSGLSSANISDLSAYLGSL